MFIGYPRSGHSLIGALIDAHPHAIIGMETDAIRLIEYGFNRRQLLCAIYNKSKQFTNIHKNTWSGYSYHVPNSYQGKYTDLLVIGDKQGAKSTARFRNNPQLLPKFLSKIGYPVKMLHVVRNPFDTISTMYTRNKSREAEFDRILLDQKIELFFKKADTNKLLMSMPDLSILTIHHEDFIKHPKMELSKILAFIGLEIKDKFLEQCASIVYNSPHQSRQYINWPEDLQSLLLDKFKNYTFLKNYVF